MDDCEWGGEYLAEAAKLREHLAPLRRALNAAAGEDRILLWWRVTMLEEMYLELVRTGESLTRRGQRKKEETERGEK